MADYEIDVPVLENSKTSLGELKETVNKIGESYISTTIKEAKEGYDIVARKITNNMERLTKGYTNSYTWFTGYTTDLNTLEQSLTSLNLATLTKPIEFKGKFNDIFGKVTMPALKTGGDPNCNAGLVDPTSEIIKEAMEKYGKEYAEAFRKYLSGSTFMTVQDLGDGKYLTHIIVDDPSQLGKGFANGAYGNGLETTSSAAAREGWVIGVNGAHFLYSNGKDDATVTTNRIVINNGQIADNSGSTAGGLEICYTKDGKFFTAPAGASAQDLINQGVVQTFSSHETQILENGTVQTTYPEAMAHGYSRTVIGYVKPGEYYIFTGYSSATDAAQTLKDHGCTWGKSLDQGGSVSLATADESIKKNASSDDPHGINGEREVGTFLYVTDAKQT